ncbi:hypothetical protein [Modestobacter sp. Leaf380]|uniref:hypothetical protein n=1 Tax=Modestobacter sp. Leaf380 TaxID=1736356 RepID=UPI0006FF7715|nr:hypothetical protein [Modestobacter sp. Leaf380]KQS68825.1 hypothetical protein ASG41_07930 [Modestobacter sp. Leaf380]
MRLGCYGFALPDLTEAAHLLRSVAPEAPALRVTQSRPSAGQSLDAEPDDPGSIPFSGGGGHVRLDRGGMAAHYVTDREIPHEHLVHPYLARVMASAAAWLDRDALHAGAIDLDGRAWGVLGTRDSGKSSLLTQAHVLGLPVLTDDVVVIADGEVLPGPASIDLREGAAEHFGIGEALGRVGRRDRWRVTLPPASAAPLAGWVLPLWDDDVSVTPVPLTSRLPVLMVNRALPGPPPDPAQFFDLAALPIVVWRRPRDWTRMAEATDVLLEHLRRVS